MSPRHPLRSILGRVRPSPPSSRRTNPHHRLHRENVDLITDPIQLVSSTGISTANGDFEEVDRIILATGFDTSFRPKYPITAREKDLGEVWSGRAKGTSIRSVKGGEGADTS